MFWSMDQFLARRASDHPNRIAVTLGDGARTYGQIHDSADKLARVLHDWGVKRGDRVLHLAAMSFDTIEVFIATSRLGLSYAPANPNFSFDELKVLADYLRPSWIIAETAQRDVAEALSQARRVPLALFGGGAMSGLDIDAAKTKSRGGALEVEPARPDDIHMMYFTSGSTGAPKAVMVTQLANWNRSAAPIDVRMPPGGGGAVIMFPLFHMAGWQFITTAWGLRRTAHLTYDARGETLLSLIERHRAADLYSIPAVWRRILECADTYDTSSLRGAYTGTSRVEVDLVEALRARFPQATNSISYGSTEVGGGLMLAHDDILRKPHSVGLPPAQMEARIVDGELVLRSDTLMSGYFERPEETAEALRDGWYFTGDLAERDVDGYYSITGRRREVIRSGGETVAPAEVEAVIASAPGIKDVAIIGLPDETWGEVVCAALVLKPGASAPTIAELRDHLGGLASFKHPRRILIVDTLPRTQATGQIQRGALQQSLIAQVRREKRS
jgi:fatty-acyl-CoA synthase